MVRVFPVLESHLRLDLDGTTAAAAADAARPMDQRPAWTTFGSAWQVRANYMMVHEHYMDFSYAPVVHARDLPPGLDSMPAFNDIEVTETTVSYTRIMPELPLTDWHVNATGLDRAQLYNHSESGTFVSPGLHNIGILKR
jgi:vanillate O-demethylase monooxygenase subunit